MAVFRFGGDYYGIRGNQIIASGAQGGTTVVEAGGYRIHTFSDVGPSTLVFSSPEGTDYLIVAGGGGGGGSYYSGGGGAGGMLTGTHTTLPGSFPVVVGSNGLGGTFSGSSTSGSDSSVFGFAAIGGGRGGNPDTDGLGGALSGGSGGGGAGAALTGALGTVGQGNNGGNANGSYAAGAGGGAGSAGMNGTANTATHIGGSGLQSAISGTSAYYCAGGGGNQYASGTSYGSRASGIGGAASGNYNYTQVIESSDALGFGSGGG